MARFDTHDISFRFARIGAAYLLALGAVACGSEEPTAEEYDDIATIVGALVADEVGGETEAMEDVAVAVAGDEAGPLGFTEEGVFEGERGSVSYRYTLSCRAENGSPVPACGGATAEADIEALVSGHAETLRRTVSFTRQARWTVLGVDAPVRTINGEGSFDLETELTALDRPAARTYRLAVDATYAGIQVRADDQAIQAGRIAYEIAAERTASNRFREVEASFDVTATLVIDEPGSATLTLDGTRTYSLDLTTGVVDE